MKYAIGDVQGCFDGLQQLINKLENPTELLFLGDVINRGDKSLATLEFIKNNNHQLVLGNHDFHLLACYFGIKKPNKFDTFTDILKAKNVKGLIDFLLNQKIIIFDNDSFFVHAGIPDIFSKDKALYLANEISKNLIYDPKKFIKKMYDATLPNLYDDANYNEALRYSLNAFLRMRFIKKNYELDFKIKTGINNAPKNVKPWFEYNKLLEKYSIYFGHWSALENIKRKNLYPLDTGYIWGGNLSAIRLDDNKIFSIK